MMLDTDDEFEVEKPASGYSKRQSKSVLKKIEKDRVDSSDSDMNSDMDSDINNSIFSDNK